MAAKERADGETRGLTPFGRSLATVGAVLLLLGLAFGVFPYLLCALLLLGVAFWARGLPAPRLRVARQASATELRAGEALDVAIDVENEGAPAALSLHERAPESFSLENGSNFAAAWLPWGARAALRYTLRAPRRGAHPLGPIRATAYDPFFVQTARVAEVGAPGEVVVHPKTPPVPRIKTSAAWGRTHLPGGDRAVRGVQTNDFRELRPYARGDPLKQVNWKATARMTIDPDELSLIVNDYEVEGKKVVWLFVDGSPYTMGGTTTSNAFDELASACLAVAGHYLDLGHRVGFTLYGAGQTRLLYAESGELQERRIAAALASAAVGEPGEGIARAVESTKGFLAREKPLLFVFTLPGRDPDLPRALVSARALASTGRRPAPVVAVAPIVDEPPAPPAPRGALRVDPEVAARIVAIRERATLKGLERRGVTLLRYHPKTQPLSALLAKGVLR